MKGPYTKKRREKCVLFLDDGFDAEEVPALLLAAGYAQIERFTKHFPRTVKSHVREQSVKDPRVIKLCNRMGWLLVTTDSDMRYTHLEEIKNNPNVSILATAHNSVEDIFEWVDGLIKGKAAIERRFKKQVTPWFAQFDRGGRITTCYTLTVSNKTKRSRPAEAELSKAVS